MTDDDLLLLTEPLLLPSGAVLVNRLANPAIRPGAGKTRTGRFWVYVRDAVFALICPAR